MITGFNTDIEFEGVTYHVQTEDKGLSRPIIMTLVYNRGTILASKRSPYEDLLEGGLDEAVLAERLQKQHRLICAAVKAGRIEDLKQMSARDARPSVSKQKEPEIAKQQPVPVSTPKTVQPAIVETRTPAMPPTTQSAAEIVDELPTVIDGVIVLDEEVVVLPPDAVAIVSELEGVERPSNNKLNIEILGESKFRGGERRTVGFMVCRGSVRKVVKDAQVMVKILGSSFRPMIFHASTDNNGLATVNMQLPSFSSGRAAFLVRAISDGEETELRRSIMHG